MNDKGVNINSTNMIDVSVVVVTFNPSWEKLRITLLSILFQKNINMEIIISDDCSVNNYFEEVRELFAKNSFSNYYLISHIENQGTVNNLLDAVQQCKGRYINEEYCYAKGNIYKQIFIK